MTKVNWLCGGDGYGVAGTAMIMKAVMMDRVTTDGGTVVAARASAFHGK